MEQHCTTLFSNNTTCNTQYQRVVTLGVVQYFNDFGRRIDYCPHCGADLSLMENPRTYSPRAEVPGLVLSAEPFYSVDTSDLGESPTETRSLMIGL